MVTCVIIDDDEVSAAAIAKCVRRTGFLELVSVYTNSIEADKALKSLPVDLIFLDIEMPGMSGIELLDHISPGPHTIFTTSRPEYALAAFDMDVLDYLLKPISYERFLKAALKARESIERHKARHSGISSVFLKSSNNHIRVNASDICYILKEGPEVKVITSMYREDIVLSSSLKQLEAALPQGRFVRINRSCIVNIEKISSVTKNSVIIKGSSLVIGPQYREQLRKNLSI